MRHRLTCTFCKRSEDDVRKLVAGPGVYICDACIELAHRIVAEDTPRPQAPFCSRITAWVRRAFTSTRDPHRMRLERTL